MAQFLINENERMNMRHVITSKIVTMQLLQDLSQDKQEKEKRYC